MSRRRYGRRLRVYRTIASVIATTPQPIATPQAMRGGSEAVWARPPNSSVIRTRKLISALTFRSGLAECVAAALDVQHRGVRRSLAKGIDELRVPQRHGGADDLLGRRQLAGLQRRGRAEQGDAPHALVGHLGESIGGLQRLGEGAA